MSDSDYSIDRNERSYEARVHGRQAGKKAHSGGLGVRTSPFPSSWSEQYHTPQASGATVVGAKRVRAASRVRVRTRYVDLGPLVAHADVLEWSGARSCGEDDEYVLGRCIAEEFHEAGEKQTNPKKKKRKRKEIEDGVASEEKSLKSTKKKKPKPVIPGNCNSM